jgi:Flp pilus assembly protein TadD
LKTVGTLVAADHLGRVFSAAGQLEEAEQHLRRAVDGLEEVL